MLLKNYLKHSEKISYFLCDNGKWWKIYVSLPLRIILSLSSDLLSIQYPAAICDPSHVTFWPASGGYFESTCSGE